MAGPDGSGWPSRWPAGSASSASASPGLRAADVTAAALAEVRSDAFPVPTQPTAPTWGRWWRVTRAIPMKSRAVQVTRNVDYWGDGRHAAPPRHLPFPPRPAREGAGDGVRPRRRMGHRRQARAGQADDVRAGGPGLGLRRHQLPAQPEGHLARPHRRREARPRLGQGTRRRIRRRPRLRRDQRGLGRRPPLRAGGAHRRGPGVPARLRGGGHLGAGLRPLLRRHGPDVVARGLGHLRSRAWSRCSRRPS